MAKVINFPDGKEIVKKDSDTVDIIHKLGDELSLVFEKDKVILKIISLRKNIIKPIKIVFFIDDFDFYKWYTIISKLAVIV